MTEATFPICKGCGRRAHKDTHKPVDTIAPVPEEERKTLFWCTECDVELTKKEEEKKLWDVGA